MAEHSTVNIHDLIRLASVPGIGPRKIRSLLAHFHDPTRVLAASARDLIRVAGIDRKLALAILHHDGKEFAQDQLSRLNRIGGRVLTIWDPEYPDLLKRIFDPPAILYVLGNFTESDRRT
ncbi:MAG: helix-hairpin-helix domain-containing protein, partial [Bacteroidota bacterium]